MMYGCRGGVKEDGTCDRESTIFKVFTRSTEVNSATNQTVQIDQIDALCLLPNDLDYIIHENGKPKSDIILNLLVHGHCSSQKNLLDSLTNMLCSLYQYTYLENSLFQCNRVCPAINSNRIIKKL